MYESRISHLPTSSPQRPMSGATRHRRLFRVALGATLLGVLAAPTLVQAAPSSARQIERWAVDTANTAGEPVPVDVDSSDIGDADPIAVPGLEVLRIECDAPGAVAGQRARIGCRWTLPTDAPVRQLTLWRSVDGAARERVATFGWPFENSYRDVVPAETQHVAYAIIGTDGAGELVARSRADWVRLPTTPDVTAPEDIAVRTAPVPVAPSTEAQRAPTPPTPTTVLRASTVPAPAETVPPVSTVLSTIVDAEPDVVAPQRPLTPTRPTPTPTPEPSASGASAEQTERGDAG